MSATATTSRTVLRGDQTGNVTFTRLLEWLQKWMTQGSDQKIMRCGRTSHEAITALCDSEQGGFRHIPATERHNIQTPYGRVKLVLDEALSDGDIVAEDKAEIPEDWRVLAEGLAENVLSITV